MESVHLWHNSHHDDIALASGGPGDVLITWHCRLVIDAHQLCVDLVSCRERSYSIHSVSLTILYEHTLRPSAVINKEFAGSEECSPNAYSV